MLLTFDVEELSASYRFPRSFSIVITIRTTDSEVNSLNFANEFLLSVFQSFFEEKLRYKNTFLTLLLG